MSQYKRKKLGQDITTVILIGVVLVTGIVMIFFSAVNNLSFLAILGVSISFWSLLLLFFTPTKHTFLALLKASASANGSNIERALLEYNLTEKGIYLPPQNLRNFESSLIFIPAKPNVPLPTPEETSDKYLTEKKTGFYFPGVFLTPPGFALSLMFEKELGLSFRKIPLNQMQNIIRKLLKNLKFADDIQVQILDRKITLDVTGGIFIALCDETRNSQPRTHEQIGCILASAFACAFAKASDRPITIKNDTLSIDAKTLTIEYQIEEV